MISRVIMVLASFLVMALGFLAAQPVFAAADPNSLYAACEKINFESPACKQALAQGDTDPTTDLIHKTANLVALIAGIAAVIMIMLGGFYYVTSGGDPQRVSAAKSRVLSGLIGIIVIALVWVIVGIVTDQILQS